MSCRLLWLSLVCSVVTIASAITQTPVDAPMFILGFVTLVVSVASLITYHEIDVLGDHPDEDR